MLEFEAPEEFVHDWEVELDELLTDAHVGHSQEPDHYPLIRVHIQNPTEEQKFVRWLSEKMHQGDQPRDMKIMLDVDKHEKN